MTACDVLVVGAGPAGSACAQTLARAGLRVVLADQQDFPRDKVCGDGLIPDAHAAFARMGVTAAVNAQAQAVTHLGCVGPRGGRVDVPGRMAVLPRAVLDDILRRAAVDAGAQWLPRARFDTLTHDDTGRVSGATLKINDAAQSIEARWVVLATGAVPQALMAAKMCTRRSPSGVALRGYVRNPAMASRLTTMDVVWSRELKGGYGWIFPCQDGVFNVGAGLASDDGSLNLREVFDTFCRVHEPARTLVSTGEWLGPLKGAPLRCSLEGAQLARPGLMVTGEAAGSTYAFTGEGIGKAMETGMLAADALIPALRAAAHGASMNDDTVCAGYAQSVMALKPRFDLYERANKVNDHPWLIDLLLWRAKKSPRILHRMSQVLEEKGNPGNLVSMRGVAKLFLPLR
jgi:menaquinone-9 beta-reductase